MKHLELDVTQEPVGSLTPFPGNPRHGDVDIIAESIKENGFYNPLVVQKSTGHVIVGNHRLAAAKKLDLDTVPVLFVDVDDTEAKRILLADNATADKAVNDDMAIARIIRSIEQESGNTAGAGYEPEEVEDFIVLANHADAEAARIAAAALEEENTPAPTAPAPAAPAATPGAPTPGVTSDREAAPTAAPTFNGQDKPAAPPANTARRPMILDLPLDVYAWLTDRLTEILEEQGLETNVEGVLHAVAEATGTEAPALSRADKTVSDPDTDGVGELAE